MTAPKLQVVPDADAPIRPTKGQRFPVKIRPVGEDKWVVTLPCGQIRTIIKQQNPVYSYEPYSVVEEPCGRCYQSLERAVMRSAEDCRLVFAPLAMTEKSARQLAEDCDRDIDLFVKTLRKVLRERTGRDWSVTRGRGTAYSWCRIKAPKARATDDWGRLSVEDQVVLGSVLGQWVGTQGESIRTEAGVRGWYILKAIGASTDGWHVAEPGWD
jgi:hypothetical protein